MAPPAGRPRWDEPAARVPRELAEALAGFSDSDPDGLEWPREEFWEKHLQAPPAASPPRVDWREVGAVPPPGYQGPCNTCTSFAVVTAAVALHYLKTGVRVQLAAGFIHVCLLGKPCPQGAGPGEALREAAAHGIAYGFPGDYPYPPELCTTGNRFPIQGAQPLVGLNESMHAIATQGPLVGDMLIDPEFLRVGPHDVYRYQDTPDKRLHSVAVVGYDQPQGYWIVSNSFGTQWGDGGFGRIAFGSGGLLVARRGWRVIL
jgi:hypothetical protein